MGESDSRMIQRDKCPADPDIAAWVGREAYGYWKKVTHLIERYYHGVFVPEWLFGGKKHGWSLRYKKSKSFCTLIPEKNRFALLIVFGAEEREKVSAVRNSLSAKTQGTYDEAATYHDGKWVLLAVDSDRVIEDVRILLSIKRKPKIAGKKQTAGNC